MGAFLDRLDELERADPGYGPDGPAARALLEQRGLTRALSDAARRAINAWAKAPEKVPDEAATDAAEDAAVTTLWAFYLEWSGIASASLTNSTHLRWLGLAPVRTPPRVSKGPKVKVVPSQRPLALPSGTREAPPRSLLAAHSKAPAVSVEVLGRPPGAVGSKSTG